MFSNILKDKPFYVFFIKNIYLKKLKIFLGAKIIKGEAKLPGKEEIMKSF